MDVYEAVRKGEHRCRRQSDREKWRSSFSSAASASSRAVEDIEKVVIRQEKGTPIQVRNVATVTLGPDFRRGALDKDGRGSGGRRGV